MEGKYFRELVGGVTYDNPLGKTTEERGQARVSDYDMFRTIAKDLKVKLILCIIML